jgi:hypothetical protein
MRIPLIVPLTRIKHSEQCAILHGYGCNCDRPELATFQGFIIAWAALATMLLLAVLAVILK